MVRRHADVAGAHIHGGNAVGVALNRSKPDGDFKQHNHKYHFRFPTNRKYPVDPSNRCDHTQTYSFASVIALRAINACSMKTRMTVECGAARRQSTGRMAARRRSHLPAMEVLLVCRQSSMTASAKVRYTNRAV